MIFFLATILFLNTAAKTVIVSNSPKDIVSMAELDPHQKLPLYLNDIVAQIYDTPYEIDEMGKTVEGLVKECGIKSFRKNNDNNAQMDVKCSLKKGIYFHDGEELTGDDLTFSINRIKKNGTLSPFLKLISDIQKLSKYEINISVKYNLADVEEKNNEQWLFNNLKFTLARYVYVVRKGYFSKDPEKALEYPVGTGPFIFKDWKFWDKDRFRSEIILLKNKSYKKAKAPSIDILKFRFVPKFMWYKEIREGKLSLVGRLKFSDYMEFSNMQKSTEMFNVNKRLVSEFQYIIFSPDSSVFENDDIREALIHGIDISGIINNVFKGNAFFDKRFADTIFNTNSSIKLIRNYIKNNNIKSKRLEIRFLIPDIKEDTLVAEKIKNDLYASGFLVKIIKRDLEDYYSIINKGVFKDFDIFLYKVRENRNFYSPQTSEILSNGKFLVYQNYHFYILSRYIERKNETESLPIKKIIIPVEGPINFANAETR